MADFNQAFRDRLVSDATLSSLLTEYPSGSGNASVFTTDPIPEDAVLPFVVTVGRTESPVDTKTTRMRELFRDIRCYADANGDTGTIEQIAERVRDLFHRFELSITGYTTVVGRAAGITLADQEDVYGRVVTVHLTLEET